MDYIKTTTDKLVAVSQDRDSSDGMATKQFNSLEYNLNITWALNNHYLMKYWTPTSQNLVNLHAIIS